MKCEHCGYENPKEAVVCEYCGKVLPQPVDEEEIRRAEEAEAQKQLRHKKRLRILLIVIAWIVSLIILGIGIYKLIYWIQDYRITRLYTRGAYTPVLIEKNMSDGREGHSLVFYGDDGDKIFLPERNESLTICGGVARLEVADSDWFKNIEGNWDYANISFNPILIKQNGRETQLPTITYQIPMPESPLNVISPASNNLNIITSTYPLELQVVSGSNVYVNGEDVTARLDRSGYMSADLRVQPIGENIYTVVVRTPQHKETRRDISITRQHYDIEIELDADISNTTTEKTMVISGKCEQGATITVDTPYIEESYQMDMSTGRFAFIAEVDSLGENIIRFRATMPGRQDAIINMTVNYTPTLAQYSAKAWAMDYVQLAKYFENWKGRVFFCKGPVLDKYTNDEGEFIIMDVNPTGEQQLVVLQNYSKESPTIGAVYQAYADVLGRSFYVDNYYPLLAARYIDAGE